MPQGKPDFQTSVERLALEVETSLSRLELHLGAAAAQALHTYVTAQIALLSLEFKALATQSAEEELGVTPSRQIDADSERLTSKRR